MPLYQKWIPGEVRHGGCYSWRVLCKAPAYSYSIRQTLDEKGEVVSAQNYYAFGSISESYDNSDTYGIYKYTGKNRDKESDYDYFACPSCGGRQGIMIVTLAGGIV